jgi:hypothetical protein
MKGCLPPYVPSSVFGLIQFFSVSLEEVGKTAAGISEKLGE